MGVGRVWAAMGGVWAAIGGGGSVGCHGGCGLPWGRVWAAHGGAECGLPWGGVLDGGQKEACIQ